jgi:hypothetical protein
MAKSFKYSMLPKAGSLIGSAFNLLYRDITISVINKGDDSALISHRICAKKLRFRF